MHIQKMQPKLFPQNYVQYNQNGYKICDWLGCRKRAKLNTTPDGVFCNNHLDQLMILQQIEVERQQKRQLMLMQREGLIRIQQIEFANHERELLYQSQVKDKQKEIMPQPTPPPRKPQIAHLYKEVDDIITETINRIEVIKRINYQMEQHVRLRKVLDMINHLLDTVEQMKIKSKQIVIIKQNNYDDFISRVLITEKLIKK